MSLHLHPEQLEAARNGVPLTLSIPGGSEMVAITAEHYRELIELALNTASDRMKWEMVEMRRVTEALCGQPIFKCLQELNYTSMKIWAAIWDRATQSEPNPSLDEFIRLLEKAVQYARLVLPEAGEQVSQVTGYSRAIGARLDFARTLQTEGVHATAVKMGRLVDRLNADCIVVLDDQEEEGLPINSGPILRCDIAPSTEDE